MLMLKKIKKNVRPLNRKSSSQNPMKIRPGTFITESSGPSKTSQTSLEVNNNNNTSNVPLPQIPVINDVPVENVPPPTKKLPPGARRMMGGLDMGELAKRISRNKVQE